jgi:hypothetical protein
MLYSSEIRCYIQRFPDLWGTTKGGDPNTINGLLSLTSLETAIFLD